MSESIKKFETPEVVDQKPALEMLEYGPGEVRLYPKTDRVFASQEAKDAYLKKRW